MLIDDVYARAHKLHAGDTLDLGLKWHVAGVVESGKLSHMFAPLESLQDKYSAKDKVSVVYVKIDDPKNMAAVIDSLQSQARRLQGFFTGRIRFPYFRG